MAHVSTACEAADSSAVTRDNDETPTKLQICMHEYAGGSDMQLMLVIRNPPIAIFTFNFILTVPTALLNETGVRARSSINKQHTPSP